MKYKGFVKGIELNILVGLHDWERVKAQPVVMDIEYEVESTRVVETDQIEDTVNYEAMVNHLKRIAESTEYQLIESLGHRLISEIEMHFPVLWFKLSLAKTSVIECAQACGIVIERHYDQG
ncbi:MAG: hypothetical protein CMF51_00450 [Legionellales bacterium]|nr:hypothetical protein [Legionellales bacterium]|tara:strand:+ start:673 stop:1035 length:363 start_codon:yes stop_codon:yes gene_type:complete